MEYIMENIRGTTLPDIWFQTVYKCIEKGRDFQIDEGSNKGRKRLEFDYITLYIKHPEIRPLLPVIPEQYNLPDPVEPDYLNQYLSYLMTGKLEKNESYTYGQRLTNCPIDDDKYNNFNQIEHLIKTYKEKGHRNNQMILQVGHPTDMLIGDPPCLRHIDTRIQDNKLHFIVYFRSWDLWNGLPANLGAIQLMKEFIASEIGIEPGVTIASSKGLHLYDYVWELAEIVRGKSIETFRETIDSTI